MSFTVALAAVDVALKEVGVHEIGGNNRGARIEEYQKAAGARPGDSWCASFVYWCFVAAAAQHGERNPCPRTPGALALWHRAPADAQLIKPTVGSVFVVDHGKGHGHVGFVEAVGDSLIYTIEGNTNSGGSSEGDAVMRRTRRIVSVNVGYLLFADLGPLPRVS